MSTYYYYVNKTKHEYFSSGDMGYGLREYPYRQQLLPLIGYLQINHMYVRHMHNEPCSGHEPEDKEDFPLEGHWACDDVELISEHEDIYDQIWDCKRLEGYSGPQWTNISKQLFEEYNSYIKYWNNPDDSTDEKYKQDYYENIEKMSIPIGGNGAHFD